MYIKEYIKRVSTSSYGMRMGCSEELPKGNDIRSEGDCVSRKRHRVISTESMQSISIWQGYLNSKNNINFSKGKYCLHARHSSKALFNCEHFTSLYLSSFYLQGY